ncbi:hypothetical protein ABZZ80_46550, partial [Streptomyces sp. NPDC006356]
MCTEPAAPNLLIHPDEVERFDRGGGVATIPYVGKWNSEKAVMRSLGRLHLGLGVLLLYVGHGLLDRRI